MGRIAQGIPASPGIVTARAYVLRMPDLSVAHATVDSSEIDAEAERFRNACQIAADRTLRIRASAERRMGTVPAKIFDPQLLMLQDPELVDATLTYIRDSRLTAARAFWLRVLELRSQWLNATHARVVDRLVDLADVEERVLAALGDIEFADPRVDLPEEPVILVSSDLTPSRAAALDTTRVVGIATDLGTRTAHSSILARSLDLPAVVGLGDLSKTINSGVELILDGDRGRVVLDPSDEDRATYRDRDLRTRIAESELASLASLDAVTLDGVAVELHANLDFPADAGAAVTAGADGVGLMRTEFLVVGVSEVPDEQEQYEAFTEVAAAFSPRPVVIRTYDLGGDKYPMFLPPLMEENPFLGWRGIRVYDLMPELLRYQVRAVLRAAAHGNVSILFPMVNSVDEVESLRSVVESARDELAREGVEHGEVALGIMLETPAAIAIADVLARYVDFFSIGTNDLAQYALAVDRGNAQLSRFYDGFHPALIRLIRDAVEAASRGGRPLSVCGEAASDRVGAALLLGLGIRCLSCSPSAIPRLKKLIRSVEAARLRKEAKTLLRLETGADVRRHWLKVVREIEEVPV